MTPTDLTCFLNRYVMKLQTFDASSRQAFKLICRDFHIGTLDGIRAVRVRGARNMGAGADGGEAV